MLVSNMSETPSRTVSRQVNQTLNGAIYMEDTSMTTVENTGLSKLVDNSSDIQIPELFRPQINESILHSLNEKSVVAIIGNHGTGKTTQLKQFYEANKGSSIIYFSAKSKNQTNLADFYTTLSRQLGYLVGETAISIQSLEQLPEDILESKFTDFLIKASKNSLRFSRNLHILIDDFDVIHKSHLINKIYSSPIFSGLNGVKVLLTAREDLGDEISYATILPISFSPIESRELYRNVSISENEIAQLIDLSRGLPV